MARRVRVEFPGAVYHVMSRGNRGQVIFRGDRDRTRVLKTLTEGCEKIGWLVHAYVLMGNHFHLLLETPEANLVAGMKWLNGTYTQRFNARHNLFGHLLQGRYKAILVDESDEHYFQVVRSYIHLNPARAGLIRVGEQSLKDYSWSSYPHYLRRRSQRPNWLCVDRVLGSLEIPADTARGRRGYEVYMEGRVLELGCERGRETLQHQWQNIRRG